MRFSSSLYLIALAALVHAESTAHSRSVTMRSLGGALTTAATASGSPLGNITAGTGRSDATPVMTSSNAASATTTFASQPSALTTGTSVYPAASTGSITEMSSLPSTGTSYASASATAPSTGNSVTTKASLGAMIFGFMSLQWIMAQL